MWTASGILPPARLTPWASTLPRPRTRKPPPVSSADISVTETATGAAESVAGAVTETETETGAAESAAGVADSLNRARSSGGAAQPVRRLGVFARIWWCCWPAGAIW